MLVCGNSYRCTGCRICEAMCSLKHFSFISPSRGHIKIKREDLGADRIFVCRQCEEPACVEACPEEALWKEDQYVKFDKDLCAGCFACVDACPYDGIWTHPDLDYPPVRIFSFHDAAFSEGIEIHEIDGVRVRVYGPEKTLADCFKYRNKIGVDVAIEALRDCRRQKKCTNDDLWRFAKICRVATVMKPYLETVG